MDFKERDRFGDGSYPKLKQLLDCKHKLIKEREHPPLVYSIPKMQDLNFLMLSDIKFDVIVLKLPQDASFDVMQNTMRMDLIADSPSFLVIGCGSTLKGLNLGRKLLKEWGYRRSEDIVWLK